MFTLIKPLFFLVPLSIISLTSCSSESSSEEKIGLKMGTGLYINALNQGSYSFSGTCIKDGENSIGYSVESSGSSEETAPFTGSINCVDDAWELPLTDIGSLLDGKISVSLSYAKLSAFITVIKDTVAPVFNSITYRQGGSLELACDGTSACNDSYTYRWIANSSTPHTFAKDVEFSAIALNSLLDNVSSNGDQDLYFHMQVRDEAGNISSVVKSGAFRYDNTAPQITTVTGQSGNSVNTSYGKEGDTVTLSVSFSENVTASGTPALDLGHGRTADCSNCTGGSKKILIFSYQVVSTDNGGVELRRLLFDSSEKIIDGGSNKVVELSAPIVVSGITLDTTAPSVKNIAITNNNNAWIWGWGCSEAICQYRHAMKRYTAKVYFENSTCDDGNALITEGHYYRNVNLELHFDSSQNYSWNTYDNSPNAPLVQLQKFKFYSKVVDVAKSLSSPILVDLFII